MRPPSSGRSTSRDHRRRQGPSSPATRRPKRVVFVDEVPRPENGKGDYRGQGYAESGADAGRSVDPASIRGRRRDLLDALLAAAVR